MKHSEALWIKQFPVSESDQARWKKSKSGAALLFWALGEKIVPRKKYFDWAVEHYKLPFLNSDFFESILLQPRQWSKMTGLQKWSQEVAPVWEWEDMFYVGCVEPPEDCESWTFPYRLILVTDLALKMHWRSVTKLAEIPHRTGPAAGKSKVRPSAAAPGDKGLSPAPAARKSFGFTNFTAAAGKGLSPPPATGPPPPAAKAKPKGRSQAPLEVPVTFPIKEAAGPLDHKGLDKPLQKESDLFVASEPQGGASSVKPLSVKAGQSATGASAGAASGGDKPSQKGSGLSVSGAVRGSVKSLGVKVNQPAAGASASDKSSQKGSGLSIGGGAQGSVKSLGVKVNQSAAGASAGAMSGGDKSFDKGSGLSVGGGVRGSVKSLGVKVNQSAAGAGVVSGGDKSSDKGSGLSVGVAQGVASFVKSLGVKAGQSATGASASDKSSQKGSGLSDGAVQGVASFVKSLGVKINQSAAGAGVVSGGDKSSDKGSGFSIGGGMRGSVKSLGVTVNQSAAGAGVVSGGDKSSDKGSGFSIGGAQGSVKSLGVKVNQSAAGASAGDKSSDKGSDFSDGAVQDSVKPLGEKAGQSVAGAPAGGKTDATKDKFKLVERSTEERDFFPDLREKMQSVFSGILILKNKDNLLYPDKWAGRVQIKDVEKSLISLKVISVFSVLLKGFDYHGFVVENSSNQKLFRDIGWPILPKHITAIPITGANDKLDKVFMGISVKALSNKKLEPIKKTVLSFFTENIKKTAG